jgi:lipopolysaccharide transport system permease protein
MTAATATGLGLIAATLNAKYRDFQQLIPFLLQLGMVIYRLLVTSISSSLQNGNGSIPLNPMQASLMDFGWDLSSSSDSNLLSGTNLLHRL